jgi:hypothetical protein
VSLIRRYLEADIMEEEIGCIQLASALGIDKERT